MVAAKLPVLLKENKIETIIFDPPRKGLNQKTIELLLENELKK